VQNLARIKTLLAVVATKAWSAAVLISKGAMIGTVVTTKVLAMATVGLRVALSAAGVAMKSMTIITGAAKAVMLGAAGAMKALAVATNIAKFAVKGFFRATVVLGLVAAAFEGIMYIAERFGPQIKAIWNDPSKGAGMLQSAVQALVRGYEFLKGKAIEAWTAVQPYILQAWEWLKGVGAWLMNVGSQAWGRFREVAVEAWLSIQRIAMSIWTPVKEGAVALWAYLSEVIERNKGEWNQWAGLVVEIFQNTMDIMFQLWGGLVEVVNTTVSAIVTAFQWMGEMLNAAFTAVLGWFGVTVQEMQDGWFGFITSALDMASLLTTDLGMTWELMKTALALALTRMADKALMVWNTIRAVGIGTGMALVAGFKAAISNIGTMFHALVRVVTGLFKGLWAGIKSKFTGKGFMKGFKDAFDDEMAKVGDFENAGQNASEAFNQGMVENMGEDSPMAGVIDLLEADQAKLLADMKAERDRKRRQREIDKQKDRPAGAAAKGKSKDMDKPTKEGRDAKEWEEKYGDDEAKQTKQASPQKASFVGIAEMSRKIQTSIADKKADPVVDAQEKGNDIAGKNKDVNVENGKKLDDVVEQTEGGNVAVFGN